MNKENYIYPDQRWVVKNPESQGMDSEKLEFAMRYLQRCCGVDGARGAMVIRNGYVVWQGDEVDRLHDIRSCSKVITSTVMGCMVDEGMCTINTKASDYHEELKKDYADVELRHFASMTSGYNSIGGKYGCMVDGLHYNDGSLTPSLPREPIFKPGEFFHYHDNALREYGYVLSRISKESLEQLFRRSIADKIGINKWYWADYLDNDNGNDPASSMYISASEFAKLGLLYLYKGNWKGEQVLSESWIDMATTTQTAGIPDYEGKFYRGLPAYGTYGFNWWVNVESDHPLFVPDLPVGSYSASGFNNNHMWVIPEWDMVVVRLGTDGSIGGEIYKDFFTLLKMSVY